ncbi:hypothetical protein N7448_001484 [Penicillium atrosanguineum]|uniref:RRM domain-containing protein n=1 Tax=Penicillium atrosanguineum TaxID=1132637 RepID=A0A9W9HJR3_9EURO|nr:Amino acid transporter transmembrane [Penicillium atrosanguineum]KAJ5133487.1 hypothetical protein N7526_004852 [Penicillium atrosanguineum]KAJ5149906.1 hypothetical protein N7448_001484 [Penicillium atrosanguineum]KAJ5305222.1 Amino acid transporter transmembrane [Penicillium atrosanguineum]KAJ5324687.1 hypothetical protein N7476_003287 [Penicillium atrosanguineum]
MAKSKPSPSISFDDIIKSDRQKKQHEQLASQLLGRNRNKKDRRASAPGPGAVSKAPTAKPGSLASRIGMPKRSASTSSRPNQTNKPKPNPASAIVASARTRANPANKKQHNAERLLNALETGNTQATIRQPSGGLFIKGASGPFVVVGSNFAPGTTAADIQSALEPTTGPMLSCRVTGQSPNVTAEFAFQDKWTAENMVANFHNQRADGRVLSMTLKPIGAKANLQPQANSYSQLREQADRQRRTRHSEPGVQDGSYGFNDNEDVLSNKKKSPGFYSDQMMVDAPAQKNQQRRRRQR